MKRPRRLIAGLALLAAGGACGGAPGSPETTPTTSIFRVGEFSRPASLEGEPCGLAVTARDVWILECSGNLSRLPKAGGDISVKPLGGEVLSLDGLVAGSASLWGLVSMVTPRTRDGNVVAVDVSSGAVGAPVKLGASVPMSAAETPGGLWVGMLDGRLLSIRDATVEEIAREEPLVWLAAADGDLWTISENGTISLRAATGGLRVRHERAAPDAIAAAAAFGAFYAATPEGVVRVVTSGAPRPIPVQGTVNAIEPCGERVWLSQPDFGIRSLGADGDIENSLRLAVAPRYLACDGTTLWVLAEDGRLGSVTIGP
jgi:hypothetical protein